MLNEPSATVTAEFEKPPASPTTITITPLIPTSPESANPFVFASHRIRPVTVPARAAHGSQTQAKQVHAAKSVLSITTSYAKSGSTLSGLFPNNDSYMPQCNVERFFQAEGLHHGRRRPGYQTSSAETLTHSSRPQSVSA